MILFQSQVCHVTLQFYPGLPNGMLTCNALVRQYNFNYQDPPQLVAALSVLLRPCLRAHAHTSIATDNRLTSSPKYSHCRVCCSAVGATWRMLKWVVFSRFITPFDQVNGLRIPPETFRSSHCQQQ